MAYARIRVDLPDEGWKAAITRECPDTVVCLSNTMLCDEYGLEVAVVSGSAVEAISGTLCGHPDTGEVTVVQRTDDTATVQVETVTPVLASAAHHSGTPVAYPIELHEGEAVVGVVSTHDRISAFGAQLERVGLGFEVRLVQRDREHCRVLTERQREVVLAAVEHGYYETPRRCSLTELADEMGIAKSTCSGTLQRAEEALVEYFLTNRSTPTQRHWDDDVSTPGLSSS